MRRGDAVVNGAVGLNKGGQRVADFDKSAVLRIEAVGVAVLMQFVEGGERVDCA